MLRSLVLATVVSASLLLLPHCASAEGDAARGAEVFKKCSACHALEPGPRVGPSLAGLFGRTAGTLDGFNYSDAMKKAGEAGLVWSEETLLRYLAAPKAFIPGTKMAFAGLKDPQDAANLTAYLKAASP